MVVFLNIGSNLGSRRLNLSRAVRAIEKEFGYFEISHTVESEPVGFESENRFLNVGLMVHSDLPPEQILEKLQAIEKEISPEAHRDEQGNYIDREIDIDIIAIDEMVVRSESLTLPHPRMHERSFVLEPMAELAPGWVHPIFKKNPRQMLQDIAE